MRCSVLMLPGLVLVGMLKISSAEQFSDYAGVKTYADRGLEAENKHDYETARRFFEAAVQRYPKTAFAYWNRGFFSFKRGAYGLALKDFNQAVSLQPKVWMYAQHRGLIYLTLGKYDLALADFNRILSLGPDEMTRGSLLNARGWLEATCPDPRFRDGKQAVEDAKSALRFASPPDKALYLRTLAAAYAETGDFDSAIKCEQEALTAQKNSDQSKVDARALQAYREHRPWRHHPAKNKTDPKPKE
jgi:tetratricopeptide (TPR) repeat protein